VARQAGLGKGLGALLPGAHALAQGRDSDLQELSLDLIEPNPNQPRVHFDEEALAELADSIKELGVIQPIIVRPIAGGRYQLIAGERRWRASRRAGRNTIPAIVRPVNELTSVEQALVENLQREDLTPLEEASAYQQLIEEFGYTHDQLSARVGKSRPAVTNSLRLLELPPGIQQLLADGRLRAGHARALLGTDDRPFQEQLARRAAAEGWSVRAVEDAVRSRSTRTTPATGSSSGSTGSEVGSTPTTGSRLRSPAVLEVEDLLADYLATRVTISTGGQRGKMTIEFADLDDLGRIYRQIVSTDQDDE
jgi:ParB family chromosome partitioning protein